MKEGEGFRERKTHGRLRAILLDALTQENEEGEINYVKLKKHMTEKLGITEKEPALGQITQS